MKLHSLDEVKIPLSPSSLDEWEQIRRELIANLHFSSSIDLLKHDAPLNAKVFGAVEFRDFVVEKECRVNVDKFWDDIPGISALIRELGMNDQVIIKAQPKEENLRLVRQYAPDMPFMPVLFADGGIHEMLLKDREIRYAGAEVIFDSEDSEFCQTHFMPCVYGIGYDGFEPVPVPFVPFVPQTLYHVFSGQAVCVLELVQFVFGAEFVPSDV